MRRATGITLVLMGGGLAVGLVTCRGPTSAECYEARRQGRPDADRICSSNARSGGSGGSSSHSGGYGHSGSERGGFGGTGFAHASAGG